MAAHYSLVLKVQTVRRPWAFIDYPSRLDEWRRWLYNFAGIGPQWPGCGSIESRFLHPQRNHWTRDEEPKPPEIIEPRAWEVEDAVRGLSNEPLSGPRSASERKIFRIDVLFRRDPLEADWQFDDRKRRYCRLPEHIYINARIASHSRVMKTLGYSDRGLSSLHRQKYVPNP